MKRRWKIVWGIAAALAIMTGCSSPPERWEERGFDSEAECWLHHGWDGTVDDGTERYDLWQFWCGPIEDRDNEERDTADRTPSTTRAETKPTASSPSSSGPTSTIPAEIRMCERREALIENLTVETQIAGEIYLAALSLEDLDAAQAAYDEYMALLARAVRDMQNHLSDCQTLMSYLNPDSVPQWEARQDIVVTLSQTRTELGVICRADLAPFGFEC